MLFLNKKTGLKWEISNQEHIDRLLRDSDYEVIKEDIQVQPEVKKEVAKNTKK